METVTVKIPKDLAENIERVAKVLGFKDVDEFIVAAARRLLNGSVILMKDLIQS